MTKIHKNHTKDWVNSTISENGTPMCAMIA